MTSLNYLTEILSKFTKDIKTGAGKSIESWYTKAPTKSRAFYISWMGYEPSISYTDGTAGAFIENLTIYMKSPKIYAQGGVKMDIVEQIDEVIDEIQERKEFRKQNIVNTIIFDSATSLDAELYELIEFNIHIIGS